MKVKKEQFDESGFYEVEVTVCDICGEEIKGVPFTLVFTDIRLEDVCNNCMNLIGNGEWEKVAERLEKNKYLESESKVE